MQRVLSPFYKPGRYILLVYAGWIIYLLVIVGLSQYLFNLLMFDTFWDYLLYCSILTAVVPTLFIGYQYYLKRKVDSFLNNSPLHENILDISVSPVAGKMVAFILSSGHIWVLPMQERREKVKIPLTEVESVVCKKQNWSLLPKRTLMVTMLNGEVFKVRTARRSVNEWKSYIERHAA